MADALPFTLTPEPARLPVLLSVPHAGRRYTDALLSAARVSAAALGVLEDPHVDRLIGEAIGAGARAIVAHAPRAEIDLNRSPDDLDPAMIAFSRGDAAVSRRAVAGLGLIPSRLAVHGAIWRRALTAADVERRMAAVHRPYHDAIAAELRALRDRFGVAVLVDCHSMPPHGGDTAPGVVLGDRHGTTCDERIVAAATRASVASGYPTRRNDPYAGGEIVMRHGRPADSIHALQIEIDRRLYLAGDLRTPGAGIARTIRLIGDIVRGVSNAAHDIPAPIAQAAE